MTATTQCFKCGRSNARPFEVRLFRKLGAEYAPRIPHDAGTYVLTDFEPAANRTFYVCANCQTGLYRATLVIPGLRILLFAATTLVVVLFWNRAGEWQFALGLIEFFAGMQLFAALDVLGRLALNALLSLSVLRQDLLIDAAYPVLQEEFGAQLAMREETYTAFPTGVPHQVGKLHALSALEIAGLAPKQKHIARLREPQRPGANETPLQWLRFSAVCAGIVGVCFLLGTQRLFPLMPGFVMDDEEGRWDILVGFLLAMPQIAIPAFAAAFGLYALGHAIWLWLYRRGQAHKGR